MRQSSYCGTYLFGEDMHIERGRRHSVFPGLRAGPAMQGWLNTYLLNETNN